VSVPNTGVLADLPPLPPLTLPQLVDLASRDDDQIARARVDQTLEVNPRWRSVARTAVVEQRRSWGDSVEDAERHVDTVLGAHRTVGPRPALHRIADVEPEEVRWLWEPYIPRRKITLLEGDPGIGKTWVALSIAAITTHGGVLPTGERARPGRVLYLSAEDGLGDTLRPRLDAAGADPTQVFALTGIIRVDPATGEEVEEGGISLADIPTIEAALAEVRPSLTFIDPIQAYLGAGVDAHRANEVRPVLARVRSLG
jgi:hypothetical protein